MPTYEYECERCKRVFEAEQKITDAPLVTCPQPDPRTVEERWHSFETSGGAISWNHNRPFSEHPDRCRCQGDDPIPHRHYPQYKGHPCARGCSGGGKCDSYQPAIDLPCGGTLKRLISSTSFILKGSGWYKDGY